MDGLERNQSLWMHTAPPEERYPALRTDIEADVVVIGAGIAGLSAAYHLHREGARVVVIERGVVGGGVTGFTTGKVTSLHGLIYAQLEQSRGAEAARIYGEANQAGVESVFEIANELGCACDLERLPALTYTESDETVETIKDEVAAARRAGLPASFVTDTELPFPIKGAVRFDDQVHFHPRRYLDAVAAAAGDIYEHTEALDVDGTTVRTEHGEIRADHVVITTQLPFINRGLFFAKTSPERSYAIAAQYPNPPKGMYLSADLPVRSIRPHLSPDGSWLIVGGENHKVGHEEDTPARYTALEEWASDRFDMTAELRWSAHDYMPADDLPYIGRASSRSDKVFVATGFKKWGLSTGAFAGILITDLINGRANPWHDLFDATRIDIAHSGKTLVKENVDVAKRFVGDRVATLRPRHIKDLRPGEGALVDNGNQIVAAFRDDDGGLHQVSPVCTHLGCRVAFNAAERSWDCPCHGSRFTIDGQVLQGPAVEDLERVSEAPQPRTASN